jgi:hypothetical protein
VPTKTKTRKPPSRHNDPRPLPESPKPPKPQSHSVESLCAFLRLFFYGGQSVFSYLEFRRPKVYQKPMLNLASTKVAQKLRSMLRNQSLASLHFYNKAVINKQIRKILSKHSAVLRSVRSFLVPPPPVLNDRHSSSPVYAAGCSRNNQPDHWRVQG